MTLLEKLNSTDRFAASIGARLIEVGDGFARAELTVEERHLNGAGVCQGGAIFTLADLTLAAVMNSHGILTVGVSNNINYVRSAKLGERIVAECRERVNHHKLPCCDITVCNEAGDVLATMTGLGYRTKNEFEFESLQ